MLKYSDRSFVNRQQRDADGGGGNDRFDPKRTPKRPAQLL
jgi:hypothetical protein